MAEHGSTNDPDTLPGARHKPVTLKVSRESDAIYVSSEAARYAEGAGFAGKDLWEVAIAVSELVTNVLKYAGTGRVILCKIDRPRVGIEIVVEDEGPGIQDIESALIDGFSEGRMLSEQDLKTPPRGLGAGLGAVDRLMDETDIENKEPSGTRVTIRKWLPDPR
jgi:serine/threonine-protein kinase RsbT